MTNEKLPLISIIVPVYNTSKYLRKCLDSMKHQTYANIEVILVDDGSTDESVQICDEYAKEDEKFKVIHKINGGQGSARNVGLDNARGDLLAFLDSDDSMEKDCLKNLYEDMLQRNLDIASCNYGRYDEEGVFLSRFEDRYSDFVVDGIEAQKRIWYAECINLAPWGKVYKRELWKGIRFEECRYYEDYATMHKVYLQADRFGYIHEPQIRYLVRKGSDVRSFNQLKLKTLDIADAAIEFCKQNELELLNAAIKKAVNMYFHNYLNMPPDGEEYKLERERIKTFIKKYRMNVLLDKRADKKVKVALLMCMFSYRLVQKVYAKKKKEDILF